MTRKILTIAITGVRRVLRDRSGLFFIFVLPVLIILVIGLVFGGGFTPRVGLVVLDDGALAAEASQRLMEVGDVKVVTVASEAEAAEQVRRSDLEAAVVIPAGWTRALLAGEEARVRFVADPDAVGFELRALVEAPLRQLGAEVLAARFAAEHVGVDLATALETARAVDVPGVAVNVVGDGTAPRVGPFDLGAAQNLIMFIFVTSLASSATLIQSRRLGVSRRMLSTPTPAAVVVVGETLARFLVAMVQAVFIVVVAAVAFGVDWGDPIAATAIVVVFAAVATGAGILLGSFLQNDAQAGGLGSFLGIGLGALGGCMIPLEVFSPTMRQVAHVTPHAWAVDAFTALVRDDAGLRQVLPELAVLVGYAALILGVAAFALRRTITAA